MLRASGFALLFSVAATVWAAGSPDELASRQQEAKEQQAELRTRIEALQKEIESHESSRRNAADELKASESAISAINRRLADLAAQKHKTGRELKELGGQITRQKSAMAQRQHELAEQLRAQYASGLSPWTALLSGDDPQAIGRDLRYLGYVSEARADTVRAIKHAVSRLADLQGQAEARQKELDQVELETVKQKDALEEKKQERQQVLERIDDLLKKQRTQAQTLERGDKRLGRLIEGLEAAIAKQAEEARLAEAKRKAEAARKAAEARRAALEQRRAVERQRAAAREAEQAARAAHERAQREHNQIEAEKARLQVEQARAEARAAERTAEAARSARSAKPAPSGSTPSARADSSSRVAPAGGFKGLDKSLPYPVRGEVQGRFGAERPEGGLWRGIVLRAVEGVAVHAIAPGRVVYANWLSGFGNLMIVDHGAKYLSVYGYNQSLLKQVGDIVHTGDTIATVGATGGQVESGLYFEIRHQGSPVNPLLWLSH